MEIGAVAVIQFIHGDTYYLNLREADSEEARVALLETLDRCHRRGTKRLQIVFGPPKGGRRVQNSVREVLRTQTSVAAVSHTRTGLLIRISA